MEIEITQESFAKEFETMRNSLKGYLLRLTASQEDTEDVIQETWIKASQKLETFRQESSLKTWVFTIASNIAKDSLRKKKRWPETVTDICKEAAMQNPEHFQEAMQIVQTSEYAKFEIQEHIAFCFTCISKSLPLEQHLCILLKEVYDFQIKEVAIIMDTTEPLVKYHLHTGRQKMIEVFDGRCALINKEGACHQCTEINGIFNPKQDIQQELVKIKMVKEADKGDKERLMDLRLEVLKGIDPYHSGAHELQLHHLEHNRKVMEKY
ncbi:MAG: sigma-70 family RNA polymerase sigma factor, partial [Flavobacteriales bacterium]|nr:sigma-70 family RNA polymerase sigma factor [Flavobacteriales bacterium]